MGRWRNLIVFMCLSIFLTSTIPVSANPYTPDEMLVVTGFTITIDNAGTGTDPDSAWETCSGGALNIEIADSSTGSDQFHTTTPGHKYLDNLTLRGPMTPGRKALMDWINNAASRNGERADATLDIKDNQGQAMRTLNYFDCLPVSYKPPAITAGENQILEERFEFKPVYINDVGNAERGVNIRQDVSNVEGVIDGVFSFYIEEMDMPLYYCDPGGVEFILEEAVGGDEPWDNKPGKGNEWVGGDEPWENKPGLGYGSDWVGGDEPWENKPGKGKGSDWVGGDEPWENKPGWGGGSDWVGGDEPWDNKFIWLDYKIVDVEYGTWTIMREYDRTDLTLLIMYEEFASGMRLPSLEDKGSLTYYDRAGNDARTIDFFAYMPITYEVINMDAKDGSSLLIEKVTLRVNKVSYN